MSKDPTRTRARTVPLPFGVAGVRTGKFSAFYLGSWRPSNNVSPSGNYWVTKAAMTPAWLKLEVTTDESHGLPPYRTGGPFTNLKVRSEMGIIQGIGSYNTGLATIDDQIWGQQLQRYEGGFLHSFFPTVPNITSQYTDSTKVFGSSSLIPSTSGWGPKVWAMSAPKIEMASGYVFLSESRDMPRMLKQSSKEFHVLWESLRASAGSGITSAAFRNERRKRFLKQTPKQVSDSFLNQAFGWSPFLSDIGKFYTAYQNTAKYMSQMAHGNDRWKVIRRTLLDDFQTTKIASGTGQISDPPMPSVYFRPGVSVKWELREEYSTHVTSSGQFKWYKPEFEIDSNQNFIRNSAWDNINRQLTMYGVRISPSNIWRATPWTWLVDWGFNVGRSIDRLTEYLYDGVVAKYLYLMHHKLRTLVLTEVLPFKSGDVTLTSRLIIDVKQRTEAGSPYGFDSPWENLTPKKLAILAALGLSKNT